MKPYKVYNLIDIADWDDEDNVWIEKKTGRTILNSEILPCLNGVDVQGDALLITHTISSGVFFKMVSKGIYSIFHFGISKIPSNSKGGYRI